MKRIRGIADTAVEDKRPIAPVTIFDGAGRIVRVVPAAEFQHAAAAARAARSSEEPEEVLVPARRRAHRP